MGSIARIIRNLLAGKESTFTFTRMGEIPVMERADVHLYVHVPFCKGHCPYCPYYKLPFDQDQVKRYANLLIREIDILADLYGRLRVPSVYFGGGTPALLGDDLGRVTGRLADRFDVDAIAMELRPENCDPEGVARLADGGVTQVSMGVQSFQPDLLQNIGRGVTVPVLEEGLARLAGAGFKGVNADMMFVLPGQTMGQLKADMERIVLAGVDQVTCYPLFTFPYTAAGRHLERKRLQMPSLGERHDQYRFLWDFFTARGYAPTSVWSFLRPGAPRFSSVTRDSYIGLGAGAATYLPGHFWFNPFDVGLYRNRLDRGRLAGNMHMNVGPRLSDLYWLYWRLYETRVPTDGLRARFPDRTHPMRLMMGAITALGMGRREDGHIRLNRKGAFWVHLAQNHFMLDCIDTFWTRSLDNPAAAEIRI
ncbi:radical SAM protein [Pseudodesulfovibrio sp.]|uniref:coproporphyrinogen-III oxidase family protein n=1 Tax=Pseudodesulfovibrio sp. TaxID=2035812 RepID=UPI00261B81B6|nr:radical SAM protein [Pseudodesulfovibrio sp.]MDD3313621.1 radical SAM protein [Pseudodesulfovibrio sp.]